MRKNLFLRAGTLRLLFIREGQLGSFQSARRRGGCVEGIDHATRGGLSCCWRDSMRARTRSADEGLQAHSDGDGRVCLRRPPPLASLTAQTAHSQDPVMMFSYNDPEPAAACRRSLTYFSKSGEFSTCSWVHALTDAHSVFKEQSLLATVRGVSAFAIAGNITQRRMDGPA
jgi:hypothetical protein